MGNKTTIPITVELKATTDQLSQQLKKVQKDIGTLDLSKGLKTDINQKIYSVTSALKELTKFTDQGQIDLIDEKEVRSSITEIKKHLGSLFKTLEAENLKTAIPEKNAKILKELTRLEKVYNKELKQTELLSEKIKKNELDLAKKQRILNTKKNNLTNAKLRSTKIQDERKVLEDALQEAQNNYNIKSTQKNSKGKDYQMNRTNEAKALKKAEANLVDFDNREDVLKNQNDIIKYTKRIQELDKEIQDATKSADDLQKELADNSSAEGIKKQQETLQGLKKSLKDIEGFNWEDFDIDPDQITDVKQFNEIIEKIRTSLKDSGDAAQKDLAASLKVLGTTADQTTDELEDVNNTLEEISDRQKELDSIKRNILNFFSVGNAIQLFKTAVRDAFETVKELDATMTEAAVVTDFSVGDMWDKLPQYSKTASELGTTINDLYQSTTLYYQQGLKTNEAIGVGTETMKMARIAGMDATQATEAMTAALRGFNMEVNEMNAQHVNDVYSELAAITAADTQQIATAMSKTASLASSANMDFGVTSALLAQIIETTQEAPETAGTALKTIIARFSEVKKLFSEGQLTGKDAEGEAIEINKIDAALKNVGISLNDFLLGNKGLDSIFLELASKWNTLDMATQRYIATTAAGSRQQSRFLAMMSDYDRTLELVEAANNSNGASQEQFNKTLDSLSASLAKLKNAWDTFTMGLANNEILKLTIQGLTSILDTINKIIDSVSGGNGLIKSIISLGAAISGFKVAGGLLRGITNSTFLNKLIPASVTSESKKTGATLGANLLAGIKGSISGNKKINKQFFSSIFENPSVNAKIKEYDSRIDSLGQLKEQEEQLTENVAAAQEAYNVKSTQTDPKGNPYDMKRTTENTNLVNANKALDDFRSEESHNNIDKQIEEQERLKAEAIKTGTVVKTKMKEVGQAAVGAGAAFVVLGKGLKSVGFEKTGEAVQVFGISLMAVGIAAQLLGPIFEKTGAKTALAGKIASMGWLPFIGVLAAVAAAIGAVYLAFKNSPENRLKDEVERTTQAAEEAKQAAEEAKQAYDTLLSHESHVNQLKEELDSLTIGSQAWKDKLVEINGEVNTLLTNLPELSKYITYDENGIPVIDWEAAKNATQKQVNNTQTFALGAEANKLEAERNLEYYNEGKAFKKDNIDEISTGFNSNQIGVGFEQKNGEDNFRLNTGIGLNDFEELARKVADEYINNFNSSEVFTDDYLNTFLEKKNYTDDVQRGAIVSKIKANQDQIVGMANSKQEYETKIGAINGQAIIANLPPELVGEKFAVTLANGMGKELEIDSNTVAEYLNNKIGTKQTYKELTGTEVDGENVTLEDAANYLAYNDAIQKSIDKIELMGSNLQHLTIGQGPLGPSPLTEENNKGTYNYVDDIKNIVASLASGNISSLNNEELALLDGFDGLSSSSEVLMNNLQNIVGGEGNLFSLLGVGNSTEAEEIIRNFHKDFSSLNSPDKYHENFENSYSSRLDQEATAANLDFEELTAYQEHLQKTLGLSEIAAKEMAISNMKMNQGLGEVIDSYDDWTELIDKNSGLIKVQTSEDLKVFDQLKKSVTTMLNVSGELSDSFWNNAKNIDLIKQAAEGSKDALDQLYASSQLDYLNNIDFSLTVDRSCIDQVESIRNDLVDYITDNPLPKLEMGEPFTGEQADRFIEYMNEMAKAANWSGEQVAAAFRNMGYNAEIEYVRDTRRVPNYTTIQEPIMDMGTVIGTRTRIDRVGYDEIEGFFPVVKTITGLGSGGGDVTVSNRNAGAGNASKGKGGGGSKKKSDKPKKEKEMFWENPYDVLYNLTQKINEALRQREKLEKEYDRILKRRGSTFSELRRNSLDQIENLYKEIQLQKSMQEGLELQLNNIKSARFTDSEGYNRSFKSWGVTEYAHFNEEDQTIEIDWANIDKITDKKKGAAVEAYISKLEELVDGYKDTQDKIDEMNDNLVKLKEEQKNLYIELEERVKEAIVQQWQLLINSYQELSNSISSSNERIINSLQESIDLERQIRDNTKTEDEIAEKEARLAFLRRDTSNANQGEILALEKELEEMRQDYSDTLIDQSIEKMSEDNQKAQEQREHQIEIMQNQLDYAVKSGQLWDQIHSLILNSLKVDADGNGYIDINSKLIEILKRSDAFQGLSDANQEKWLSELKGDLSGGLIGYETWFIGKVEEEFLKDPNKSSLTVFDDQKNEIKVRYKDGKWIYDQNSEEGNYKKGDTISGTIAYDYLKNQYELIKYNKNDVVEKDIDRLLKIITLNIQEIHDFKEMFSEKIEEVIDAIEDIDINVNVNKGGGGGTTHTHTDPKPKDPIFGNTSPGSGNTGDLPLRDDYEDIHEGQHGITIPFNTWTASNGKTYYIDDNNTVQELKGKKHAKGGLADYTGLGWLDGTPSKPELVLNAQDTKNFIALKDVLSSVMSKDPSSSQSNGDNYFDIHIKVDELASDYDVDQMIDKIQTRINEDAAYRNVNSINFLR